jgi:GTPase involved in cell partitioning and DNA repair
MSADDKKSGTAVEPPSDAPKDAQALRAEIAEIRADLGDTVEALAAKADVKAQAQAKVEQTKEQFKEKAGQAKEQIGHVTGQLKAKAEEQTAQLRAKQQYRPWAQLAVSSVAALVLAAVGARTIQRRRKQGAARKTLRRLRSS